MVKFMVPFTASYTVTHSVPRDGVPHHPANFSVLGWQKILWRKCIDPMAHTCTNCLPLCEARYMMIRYPACFWFGFCCLQCCAVTRYANVPWLF